MLGVYFGVYCSVFHHFYIVFLGLPPMKSAPATPSPVPLALLLPLLASMVAITPLAIDLYLPAMLVIAEDFGTSMPKVQMSLSIYLAGYALGMLFFGPLADQIGRRKLALFGLASFTIVSLLLAFVTTIDGFLMLRALQAFVGAAATVVVPGIIRHLYQENTAKGMSYVSMIMMLAPLIAPSIGSLIMTLAHWQWIFISLAGYSAIILVFVYLNLFDIPLFPSDKRGIALFFDNYKTVFKVTRTRWDIAMSMLASFAFFCFLTSVPYVYLDYYSVSERLFGILFACNVLALMLGNFINTRLVPRLGSRKMLSLGLVLGLISSATLVSVSLIDGPLWAMVASIAPLMLSLGVMASNADALILIAFEHKSGTATAVIGTLRFGSGALVGPILALFHTASTVPFSAMMLGAVLIILIGQMSQIKRGY